MSACSCPDSKKQHCVCFLQEPGSVPLAQSRAAKPKAGHIGANNENSTGRCMPVPVLLLQVVRDCRNCAHSVQEAACMCELSLAPNTPLYFLWSWRGCLTRSSGVFILSSSEMAA